MYYSRICCLILTHINNNVHKKGDMKVALISMLNIDSDIVIYLNHSEFNEGS